MFNMPPGQLLCEVDYGRTGLHFLAGVVYCHMGLLKFSELLKDEKERGECLLCVRLEDQLDNKRSCRLLVHGLHSAAIPRIGGSSN